MHPTTTWQHPLLSTTTWQQRMLLPCGGMQAPHSSRAAEDAATLELRRHVGTPQLHGSTGRCCPGAMEACRHPTAPWQQRLPLPLCCGGMQAPHSSMAAEDAADPTPAHPTPPLPTPPHPTPPHPTPPHPTHKACPCPDVHVQVHVHWVGCPSSS